MLEINEQPNGQPILHVVYRVSLLEQNRPIPATLTLRQICGGTRFIFKLPSVYYSLKD